MHISFWSGGQTKPKKCVDTFQDFNFSTNCFHTFQNSNSDSEKKMIQRKPKNDKNDNKLKTKSARKCQKILHLGEKFV